MKERLKSKKVPVSPSEPIMAHFKNVSTPVWTVVIEMVCFAVAFAAITILHIVLGELAPKARHRRGDRSYAG
jgi:CBS domain containing-hemolysin-like protein